MRDDNETVLAFGRLSRAIRKAGMSMQQMGKAFADLDLSVTLELKREKAGAIPYYRLHGYRGTPRGSKVTPKAAKKPPTGPIPYQTRGN